MLLHQKKVKHVPNTSIDHSACSVSAVRIFIISFNRIKNRCFCLFSSYYSCRSNIAASLWSNVCLWFVVITIFCFNALPFFKNYLGCKYSNDCPIQPLLIIYHLIDGGVGSLFCLWLVLRALRRRRLESGLEDDDNTDYDAHLDQSSGDHRLKDNGIWFMELLAFIFLLISFSMGNYWTWSIFWPAKDMTATQPIDWCNHSLYIFTLVSIGIIYVLGIFLIIFMFSFLIFARYCARVLVNE